MKKRYVLHSYYPTYCLAHGNYDWEHYEVTYYDMTRKCKVTKKSFCESGECDTLPFNFEEESELFDRMETVEYWRFCGVSESLIQKAMKGINK